MARNEGITFAFPDISYTALTGNFDAPQDGDSPEHTHQLGFMILYAAKHGHLVDAPASNPDNPDRVKITNTVPWATNVVARVVAEQQGSYAMISGATLTADNGSKLSVAITPATVTVGERAFVLEQNNILDTQTAVAAATRAFFVEAAHQV